MPSRYTIKRYPAGLAQWEWHLYDEEEQRSLAHAFSRDKNRPPYFMTLRLARLNVAQIGEAK